MSGREVVSQPGFSKFCGGRRAFEIPREVSGPFRPEDSGLTKAGQSRRTERRIYVAEGCALSGLPDLSRSMQLQSPSSLNNTQLQLGVRRARTSRTASAVSQWLTDERTVRKPLKRLQKIHSHLYTPLKRGVNERGSQPDKSGAPSGAGTVPLCARYSLRHRPLSSLLKATLIN
jgi:hypothetical protein